ncbi:adenosine deaminase 1 [Arthrobacter sp. Hiyo8]|uniref:adenosine deaminase n=1 Tax=Arthrobacter bambusae TaxID=1338426 RepID=A0AAW8DGX4_9MICC|nr:MULTISPECIES: adenosine deaminase [Arthrobacter]BAS13506.1 adenosine deaminase 1 [Arthrobacter sp. Hiyo8]MDP9905166.1 adenosine deaminase [Arthrobacter bambusae]MDQ0132042.1 adenosine deaminase [Arthrobacter bambusae]MDQ0180298.1 adenosine deaminase [Arthrobacter bambusae]MDQ0238435.1 adenosine deaminase [Arthrobacter bambusae]
MTEPIVDAAPALDFDLKSLPKVSLHDHLDGGLRPATIIELAEAVGHTLPSTDPVALGQWFRESADSGSLVRYLETFDHTIAVMQTKEGLARVAKEFVEDLADDGVVYGEIRWAPEQHLQKGLTLDEVVDAVQEGLDAGVDAVEESGRQIQVGQLITAMRHADRGQEIAELAVRHRYNGAVGFDIAGAEDGFLPSRFKDAFTYLAEHNFPATVHAGEAAGLESIQSALVDGRALRLGHGVRIAEDITVEFEDAEGEEADDDAEDTVGMVTLGEVAGWVRDRGIALEICPSSNLQTGAIANFGEGIENHPLDMLYQLGFNVTINTDNRLMSGVTLTDEFELLVETFDYDLDDLLELTLNAAESSFLPLDEKEALVEYINDAYANLG